jgi:hypothetical protein
VLATVNALTDQADRRLRAGDLESAETLYLSAMAEIPAVSRSLAQIRRFDQERAENQQASLIERVRALEAEIGVQRSALDTAETELAEAQDTVQRLEAAERARLEENRVLSSRLARVQTAYSGEDDPRAEIPTMIDLLRAKAELKEAVESPTVRAAYPDLYEAMEDYLEEAGTLKEHTAEQEALRRVLAALTEVVGRQPPPRSEDPFEDILSALEELVSLR